ncbi:MAG: hypothetical protein ACLU4N_18680 [Butyricimonas faecihominis]
MIWERLPVQREDRVRHDRERLEPFQARDLMTLEEDGPARFTADGATALLSRVYLL